MDGTTEEDFVEQLHSLDHNKQKRMLDGPAWQGETWFKVKKSAKPPIPPITTPTASKQQTAQAEPTTQALGQQQQEARRRITGKQSEKQDEQQAPAEQAMGSRQHQPQQHYPGTAVPRPKDMVPTEDYWIREGHLWKRVHIKARTQLYIPQQTPDGPDVTLLIPERTTIAKPISGSQPYRIDDDWTTKTSATLNAPWTRSTNFEESTLYKEEVYNTDEEEPRQAKTAKGLPQRAQPTAQERAEHELTHLPFRSWCPTCVANKGRVDNHPKQTSKMPVVQFDFCYFKTAGEQTLTQILTGIDVETGMAMATIVSDKQQDFQYHIRCIQAFLMECERVQAALKSTILQSDQEDHLVALSH